MNTEMLQTSTTMKQIFGENITSVTGIVQPFGKLNDVWITGDGVYRIEYITSRTDHQEMIMETYTMAKALRPSCDCKALSLFASTGPGTGLLVYIGSDAPLITLSSFKENASFTFPGLIFCS